MSDLEWIFSPAAAQWLENIADNDPADLRLVERLRRDLSADQVRQLLAQVTLRRRGRAKFPSADQMYFTPVGLEQASDFALATYKAVRFPRDVPVADLCCGIGGDLRALCERGPSTGVDLDSFTAQCAMFNARRATVLTADALTPDLAEFAAWHIDPDRRSAGGRTTKIDHYQPNLATLESLLKRQPNAAFKLAPAATAPEHWAAELEWLGGVHDCRQLVAWFGSLARAPGQRVATVVGVDGRILASISGEESPPPVVDTVERYLHEPAAPVLAASLTGVVCERFSVAALLPRGGYLTSAAAIESPLVTNFAVVEVLPFDLRRLRAWLQERKGGRLIVKVRGHKLDPEQVRRQLRVEGDAEFTLLIAPVAGQIQAILATAV